MTALVRRSRPMPSKNPRIPVVITPELKKDFERLCHLENRSMSNMIVTLIQKAVNEAREKGLLEGKSND
ncbi:MAG: hypothetical protein IGS48_21100 [Oscillatoriales cyanobacterium C42_A2020_001]|nr:hypothetical protein [Leptolyngbyaceae cyanobacterium C42_A2020_001]